MYNFFFVGSRTFVTYVDMPRDLLSLTQIKFINKLKTICFNLKRVVTISTQLKNIWNNKTQIKYYYWFIVFIYILL